MVTRLGGKRHTQPYECGFGFRWRQSRHEEQAMGAAGWPDPVAVAIAGEVADRGMRRASMYVGQICNRDAITITAGAHILAAAQLMREQHVGYLVVVEPDEAGSIRRPVGVLTDRDIVVGIVARGKDPRIATVRDVMSPDPVTVATTASTSAAAQEMRRMGVRRLPVVGTLG